MLIICPKCGKKMPKNIIVCWRCGEMLNPKLRNPSIIMGLFAFGLEATGVASGAYLYGNFPIKLLGVPLIIPVMWVALTYLAYLIYSKRGVKGMLLVWLFDLLILEPIAYHLNWWRWTSPYSLLITPFGTTANMVVWILMCYLGVFLFKNSPDEPLLRRNPTFLDREQRFPKRRK